MLVGEIWDKEIVGIVIKVVFIGYLVMGILYINSVVKIIICILDMFFVEE